MTHLRTGRSVNGYLGAFKIKEDCLVMIASLSRHGWERWEFGTLNDVPQDRVVALRGIVAESTRLAKERGPAVDLERAVLLEVYKQGGLLEKSDRQNPQREQPQAEV